MYLEVQDRPIQTKPAVNGRDLLLSFLAQQDASACYDWHDRQACLMAQFKRACEPTSAQWRDIAHSDHGAYIAQGPSPKTMAEYYARDRYWTFGQALARAREVFGGPS